MFLFPIPYWMTDLIQSHKISGTLHKGNMLFYYDQFIPIFPSMTESYKISTVQEHRHNEVKMKGFKGLQSALPH